MVRGHGREWGGKCTIERLVPLRSDAVNIVEETEQVPISRGKDGKGETYNPGMPSMCRLSTFPNASRMSLHTHAISHSSSISTKRGHTDCSMTFASLRDHNFCGIVPCPMRCLNTSKLWLEACGRPWCVPPPCGYASVQVGTCRRTWIHVGTGPGHIEGRVDSVEGGWTHRQGLKHIGTCQYTSEPWVGAWGRPWHVSTRRYRREHVGVSGHASVGRR